MTNDLGADKAAIDKNLANHAAKIAERRKESANKDHAIKPEKLAAFITKWKLNTAVIAKRMGITPYTLKMKLSDNPKYAAIYFLNDADAVKLADILRDMAKDVQTALSE
jgi:hypothetical protein